MLVYKLGFGENDQKSKTLDLARLLEEKREKMIFIDGDHIPFSSTTSTTSSSSQENEDLVSLLEHPSMVSASNAFKAIPEIKVSLFEEHNLEKSTNIKHVYVFQREYATVDPALVQLVGTDEATTCVGLVIRNPKTGMTSVSHMDSPKVIDVGLMQMLSLIIDHSTNVELDVHLIGAYEDTISKHSDGVNGSESNGDMDNHSFPLCLKILEALQSRQEKFHIRTLFVLKHNTRLASDGTPYPIFNGFVVETCSGKVSPASFDRSSRCPDELVRRIRVTVSFEDPTWKGLLLDTYDTRKDRFQIASCAWRSSWKYIALSLQQLSDSEILGSCSTSPLAEGPDFVDNERRIFGYLIDKPDWRDTFPMRKARVFERTADGGWRRCEQL